MIREAHFINLLYYVQLAQCGTGYWGGGGGTADNIANIVQMLYRYPVL